MLISRKLPLAAAILTIVSIGIASTASMMIGSQSLEDKSAETLQAVADGRRNQIETYLNNIEKDLVAKSDRQDVQSAIMAFRQVWATLGSNPVTELQDRYIKNNPNPLGKKHLLDTAGKDAYDAFHQSYHPRFRAMLEAQEYYDIFLVDPDGNVIYTVFKELELRDKPAERRMEGFRPRQRLPGRIGGQQRRRHRLQGLPSLRSVL